MSTTTPRGRSTAPTIAGIGDHRKAATAIVFQGLIAGVLNTVAVQGDDGAIIGNQATALNTDNIIFNATTVYVAALGGGEIYVEEAGYNLAATWNVSVYIAVRGAGWAAILNYDAGGNCITFTGDNAKVRDLKIVIVAGAGAGGTRPNGILADTRTNLEVNGVWVIGDLTEADDGSDLRQCGVVFDTVTESRINGNRFETFDKHGVSLNGTSNDNNIEDNISTGNTYRGIQVHESHDNTITGNSCSLAGWEGLFLWSSDGNTVTGNTCRGNEGNIYLSDSSNNTITGNTCTGSVYDGILADSSSSYNTFTGNTCNGNAYGGINLFDCDYNTVSGNTCSQNTAYGIMVDTSNNNTVTGNTCYGNTGATTDGIKIDRTSLDNLIHDNTCNDNGRYGINIDDAAGLRNWVKNNQLRGNTSGAFNDAGTDTKTPFINVLAPNPDAFIGTHAVQQMADDIDSIIRFEVPIPREYQETVTAEILIVSGGTGDLRRAVATNWGQFGTAENYNAGSDTIAAGQVAVTVDDMTALDIAAAFTGIASEDWIGVEFTRGASNVADTVGAAVYFIGFRMRYV